MTPEEVREIVRDEVVKMLIEAGVVEAISGLLTGTVMDGLDGLLTDILGLPSSDGKA